MRKYSFVLNGLTEQFFLPGIAYYTEKTSAKRCGRDASEHSAYIQSELG